RAAWLPGWPGCGRRRCWFGTRPSGWPTHSWPQGWTATFPRCSASCRLPRAIPGCWTAPGRPRRPIADKVPAFDSPRCPADDAAGVRRPTHGFVMYTQQELKQQAADAALEYVEQVAGADVVIGVGTGSTADLFIDGLARL